MNGEDPGSEGPNEIDTLLAELIRPDDEDHGLESWHPTVASDEPRPAAAESGDRDLIGAAGTSGRRFGPLPLVVALLAVAIVASVGGYWFGTQRGDEVARPEPGATPATTELRAPLTGPVETTAPLETTGAVGTDTAPDLEETGASLRSRLDDVDLSTVGFVPGTDRLTDEARTVAAEISAVLVAHPEVPVAIEVSTFTEATPGEDHGLSAAQAQAVATALVSDGVEPTRLVPVGLGSRHSRLQAGQSVLAFDTDDRGLDQELSRITRTGLPVAGGLVEGVHADLDRVADAMTRHPTGSLTLLGHVSAESSDTSHDRSHVLVDEAIAYLTDRGVDAERLSPIGMGDAPVEVDLETSVEIAVGVPAAISLALRGVDNELIGFEPGTDQLTPTSLPVLAEIADALALDPASRLEIAAHSYSEDTSEENHDLSHLQGEAVAAALVEAGVDRDRISVIGHGGPARFAEPGRTSYVTFTALR